MIGYLPEKKEYGIFAKKYLMNRELAKQGNKSRQCANGVIKTELLLRYTFCLWLSITRCIQHGGHKLFSSLILLIWRITDI
jgi:hypothetical protein